MRRAAPDLFVCLRRIIARGVVETAHRVTGNSLTNTHLLISAVAVTMPSTRKQVDANFRVPIAAQ
jgi:hypothetical protein